MVVAPVVGRAPVPIRRATVQGMTIPGTTAQDTIDVIRGPDKRFVLPGSFLMGGALRTFRIIARAVYKIVPAVPPVLNPLVDVSVHIMEIKAVRRFDTYRVWATIFGTAKLGRWW